MLIWVVMTFCGCKISEIETKEVNNIDESENILEVDNKDSELREYKYLQGYESLPLYQEINSIESCTCPDELSDKLSEMYGEEIIYQRIDSSENLKDTDGDNSYYGFQVVALYDDSKGKYPIESSESVYVFLRPYREIPVFIMDDEGSYIVSSYEIDALDKGMYLHRISAWSITDLFLCHYKYVDVDGDDKKQEFYSDSAKACEWYMEFEILADAYINR